MVSDPIFPFFQFVQLDSRFRGNDGIAMQDAPCAPIIRFAGAIRFAIAPYGTPSPGVIPAEAGIQ